MRIGLRVLLVLLAMAGMGVSWLALKVHNQKPGEAPPCAVTERFDCGAVNHSRFAVFPPTSFDETMGGGPARKHVPVAIVGIAVYGLMGVCAAAGWTWVLFELVQVGFLMATFLTYLEAYVLEKWCNLLPLVAGDYGDDAGADGDRSAAAAAGSARSADARDLTRGRLVVGRSGGAAFR